MIVSKLLVEWQMMQTFIMLLLSFNGSLILLRNNDTTLAFTGTVAMQ